MLLLKTSGRTIDEVVRRAKHATDSRPNAQIGDLILIAQTKDTLQPGKKSIRYIMTYKGYRLDTENESKRVWGKKWKYIIDGYDVVEIRGFNIEDIQVSKKNYDPIVTHCRLEPKDEEAVVEYLSKKEVYEIAKSVARPRNKNLKQILEELEALTSNSSDVAIIKSKRYFRDPRKSVLLKELYAYRCQICETKIMDTLGNLYVETHHIKKRSEKGGDEVSNMLVLCPNHHKMFDLGSAKIDLGAKIIRINGEKVNWTNKHL